MKRSIWIVLVCLSLPANNAFSDQNQTYNGESLKKSAAVVRAVLVSKETACDKYCWYRVKLLHVFKGDNELNSGKELRVAALSSDPGIPPQECTLYLERYNVDVGGQWKLLDGRFISGVSNVGNQK